MSEAAGSGAVRRIAEMGLQDEFTEWAKNQPPMFSHPDMYANRFLFSHLPPEVQNQIYIMSLNGALAKLPSNARKLRRWFLPGEEKKLTRRIDGIRKEAIMASTLLPKRIPGMKLLRDLAAKWYWGMGRISQKPTTLTGGLTGASLGASIAGITSPNKHKLRNMAIAAAAGGLAGVGAGKYFLKPATVQSATDSVRRAIIKNFEFAPIGLILTPTPIPAGMVLPGYLAAKSGIRTAWETPMGRRLIGSIFGIGAASPFIVPGSPKGAAK